MLRFIVFFGDNLFYIYIRIFREIERERKSTTTNRSCIACILYFPFETQHVPVFFLYMVSKTRFLRNTYTCLASHTSICQGNFYLISFPSSAKDILRNFFLLLLAQSIEDFELRNGNGKKFNFVGIFKERRCLA